MPAKVVREVEENERQGCPETRLKSSAGSEADIRGSKKWRYGREREQNVKGSLVTEGELRKSGAGAISTSILQTGNDDSHADEAGRSEEPQSRLFLLEAVAEPSTTRERVVHTPENNHSLARRAGFETAPNCDEASVVEEDRHGAVLNQAARHRTKENLANEVLPKGAHDQQAGRIELQVIQNDGSGILF